MPETLTLMCIQRSTKKKIVTEEDLAQSNLDGFGNPVGKITNWVTSMYDVRAGFAEDSEEYDVLTYRIQSGQLYQQGAIDSAKGIACKPMPKHWHDFRAIEKPESDDPEELDRYELNKRIVADKKPYFMRYVYPALMKEYRTYVKDAERKARLKFNMTLDELRKSADETGDPQKRQFIDVYDHKMPVNTNNCTMNRICRRIETLTADMSFSVHSGDFNYSLMKCDAHYPIGQYYSIKKLYAEYVSKAKELAAAQTNRVISKDTSLEYSAALNEYFRREAEAICPNEGALVDIMLDLCYTHENSKQFLWNLKGEYIVRRLVEANGSRLHYPIQDPDGDFEYGGDKFSMTTMEVVASA